MKKIELSNGLKLELPEDVLDNMELVDALADMIEENPISISKVLTLVLGNQKQKLYENLRTEDGRVPVTAVMNVVKEIFEKFGNQGKN